MAWKAEFISLALIVGSGLANAFVAGEGVTAGDLLVDVVEVVVDDEVVVAVDDAVDDDEIDDDVDVVGDFDDDVDVGDVEVVCDELVGVIEVCSGVSVAS